MFTALLVIQAVTCFVLIVLVLLQQGKGADAGVTFGGSSNTLFGASGAQSLLGKLTTSTAIFFMLISVLLVRSYSSRSSQGYSGNDPLAGSALIDQTHTQAAPANNEAATAPAGETAPVQNKASAPSASGAAVKSDAVNEEPVGSVGKAPSEAASEKAEKSEKTDAPKQ